MYLKALEISIASYSLNYEKINNGTYEITNNGNICLEYSENNCIKELKIEVKGNIPNEKSEVTIVENKVRNSRLIYENKIIVQNDSNDLIYQSPCIVVSGDGTNIGDEINCAKEHFYVMKNDGNTILMLSKYNLNIGENLYYKGKIGIQNENVIGANLQTDVYGDIKFSTSSYWYKNGIKEEYGTSYPVYVFDNNSNIYEHIVKYENYLKQKGINSATGKLISYEQLEKLGCSSSEGTCLSSKYKWLYSTSYWTGTAGGDNYSIWFVYYNGRFGNINISSNAFIGVRPVVSISVSEIQV